MNRNEKRKADLSPTPKILLIRLRRIGDVVMTTPAVSALKNALPDAALTYIVEEPYRRLVEGNPGLERVISLPPRQKPADFLRFIRRLRRETYDAVLDFHGGPRASRIALLSRAKLKIGYSLKHKGFIYDIRIPRGRRDGHVHSVENHLNLVKALGLEILQAPPLFLPAARPEEARKIESFWQANKLHEAKACVLHIGAGNEFRDWGPENLGRLAGLLAQTAGVRVILAGGPEDKEREAAVLRLSQAPLLSFVGELNLIELREVLARAGLFVGPDSGPMHIAAAAQTPITAFFGPTLPAHFAPWQARATLIEKELDCRPCKQRRCLTEDFRCLRTITPEEVYQACLNYLYSEIADRKMSSRAKRGDLNN